jgi:hypothetical protein
VYKFSLFLVLLMTSACAASVEGSPVAGEAPVTTTATSSVASSSEGPPPPLPEFAKPACSLLSSDEIVSIMDSASLKEVGSREEPNEEVSSDTVRGKCTFFDKTDNADFATFSVLFTSGQPEFTVNNVFEGALKRRAAYEEIQGLGDKGATYRDEKESRRVSVIAAKINGKTAAIPILTIGANHPDKVQPRMVEAMRAIVDKLK